MIHELVKRNRSYRRFKAGAVIERETLRELLELARHSPSAANLQPLKFVLSHDEERNARVFPHLAWAGYLEDWPGPALGERPTAYIVILGDTEIGKAFDYDAGIAAQSILLGAAELGLGGCIIGSIEREGLRRTLAIPRHLEILLILALGRPAESVQIETVGPNGDIRYWRDAEGTHHVPKRSLDELIVE